MMDKRFDGRDAPILEPELPIIDAHHHLFDRPGLRYLLDDYRADLAAGHKVIASVYVETQAFARPDGPEELRPLGEIEFANGVGAMCASGTYGSIRACAALVGYADLRLGDAIAPLLDRAVIAAPDRFRGVRQITLEHPDASVFRNMIHRPPAGILTAPQFRTGFHHLSRRGLSFDAAVFHNQLKDIAALADGFPDTAIVLNHAGMAMAMDLDADGRAEIFRDWRAGMLELRAAAKCCLQDRRLRHDLLGFGFERRPDPIGHLELAAAWAPYVEGAIEAFGADRCMMESNFPVDGRSCGFVPSWNALKRIVRGASAGEKAALFHGTAARVYRIAPPGV